MSQAGDRRLLARLQRWWERRRQAPQDPRVRYALFALAAIAFVVAAVLAWRARPLDLSEVRWPVLVAVALLGVPATVLANAEEYRTMAYMAGHRVRPWEALRITVLAAAANLLPVPGGVVVRLRELKRAGVGTGRTFGVTAVVGAAWVGVTGAWAGALLIGEATVVALVALAIGVALVLGGFIGWWRLQTAGDVEGSLFATFGRLLLVEVASVGAGALRLYGVLVAFQIEATFGQAVGLTVSGVIATFAGIFPGGLGIRELAAGAISPVIDLPASAGLLSSVGNRLVEYAVMVPIALAALRSARVRSA